MFVYSDFIDALSTPEEAFIIVADLMQRGHYFPDSVTNLRQLSPRPPSETEKFLPGQRVAFTVGNEVHEHVVAEVQEWHAAEARIVERPARPLKGERLEWRLSELSPGMIRVSLKFTANYGALERLSKGAQVKKFWGETLQRLKTYLQDKESYSNPRTFAR